MQFNKPGYNFNILDFIESLKCKIASLKNKIKNFYITLTVNSVFIANIKTNYNIEIKNLENDAVDIFNIDNNIIYIDDSCPECEKSEVLILDYNLNIIEVIEIESGETEQYILPSCNQNKLPTKSGANISYATSDDGAEQRAREISFFILSQNNPFGHNRRFSGISGGYYDGTDFKDKNGTITTKDLAFPNGLMLDWAYISGTTDSGQVMMWHYDDANIVNVASREFNGVTTTINSLTFAGFSNWKMPNTLELSLIFFWGNNTQEFLNYEPIIINNRAIWLNQTDPTNTAQAYRYGQSSTFYRPALKNSQVAATRLMAVRYTTYTVVGSNVIIS